MVEKIKIICLIIITITIIFLAGIYINAYFECANARPETIPPTSSWICISILNGGGGQ